jgi:hypothetical protein
LPKALRIAARRSASFAFRAASIPLGLSERFVVVFLSSAGVFVEVRLGFGASAGVLRLFFLGLPPLHPHAILPP